VALVKIGMAGDQVITSAIAKEAAEDLGPATGDNVTVLVKSTEVGLARD
jgi:molybdopterin-binding protein